MSNVSRRGLLGLMAAAPVAAVAKPDVPILKPRFVGMDLASISPGEVVDIYGRSGGGGGGHKAMLLKINVDASELYEACLSG